MYLVARPHWIEENGKAFVDNLRDWDLVEVMPLGIPVAAPERVRRPPEGLFYQGLRLAVRPNEGTGVPPLGVAYESCT